MSYEGYVVYYCGSGHHKSTQDAYSEANKEPCVVCGNTDTFVDSIDTTNGCQCDYDNSFCSAHPKVTEIIGYTMVPCDCCNGTGGIPQKGAMMCGCGGNNKACPDCFGTAEKMVDIEDWEHILCPKCWGRKTMPIPIFDLTKIKSLSDFL